MINISNTMISEMNLLELTEVQTMIQKEIESKNQQVVTLKNSVFDAMKKIASLSGSYDFVDEIAQQIKDGTTSCYEDSITAVPVPEAEQAVEIEDSEEEEHIPEIEESEESTHIEACPAEVPVQVDCSAEDHEEEAEEELLPSLADLCAIDCDTLKDSLINDTPLEIEPEDFDEDTADPVEYRNEEEYLTIKKQAKMLQPLETLVSDAHYPGIEPLGYTKVLGGKDFKQHLRITNADSACGPTLTTSAALNFYIPEACASGSIGEVDCPDEKEIV